MSLMDALVGSLSISPGDEMSELVADCVRSLRAKLLFRVVIGSPRELSMVENRRLRSASKERPARFLYTVLPRELSKPGFGDCR